ncbi:MAG: hypothetical protein CMC16_02515 [Flavobacteriaceae bacterium]|nr:hypothetical protein [Flavobacteriaceae bacterium]|tara:strand:- start:59 stop:478 length:420 start_codon:yes stop_codon:yes gene_type:complete
MLRNVSYKNDSTKNEIDGLIGNSYSFIEKIKKGGVGSGKLLITKANKEIENLLILDQNTNNCNIELRAKGIIIYFRSLLETYGLAIPYYKLVVFKVTENEYTFNIDSKFLKIKVKSENDHSFIRKIMEEKAKNTENYIP